MRFSKATVGKWVWERIVALEEEHGFDVGVEGWQAVVGRGTEIAVAFGEAMALHDFANEFGLTETGGMS